MFKAGNVCAVAGAVLVATAASLYSASLGMQHVAIANAATSNGNATCEIATLGVFRSTYMPECAGLPGTAMTVDTLQFWPLFPAQNRFGQVSEVAAFGVGSTPFTNCENYIWLTASQLQAGGVAEISQGFAAMVLESFSELNAQLGAVKMVLPLLGIKNGMSEADWSNVEAFGALADGLLPGAGKFVQLLTQLCAPPATQTLAFCAQRLQDALSAPIDSETKTFQSPIGAVFDSYFNLTSTVVQILTSPGMATVESLLNFTLPAPIVKQLVQANDLVHGCSAAAATNAKQCALLAEVPDDGFASNYPLAPTLSATHSLGSFYDFAKSYVQSQTYPHGNQQLELVYVSLIAAANCALDSFSDAKYCSGVEAAAAGLGGFYAQTIAPPPTTLENPNSGQNNTTQARMSALVHNATLKCLLNDQDLAIFKQARSEMYAVLAFVWFAFIAAAALALYTLTTSRNDRLALFALPALATIIALVLSVVALLGLHSAPIYALVGKPCTGGQVCYLGGNSVPIAMAAIVVALAAFIAFTTLIALPACNKTYAWRKLQDNVQNTKTDISTPESV